MRKDLKGKELGKGISQRSNGMYQARYADTEQVERLLEVIIWC